MQYGDNQMDGEDHVFLDEGGILVTKTRFVSGAQTFALASISSVRGVEIPPSRSGPIFVVCLGILMAALGIGYGSGGLLCILLCIISVACIAVGVAMLCLQKTVFSVMLTTSGGEVAAYTSRDKEFIARVINALTEAIIARG